MGSVNARAVARLAAELGYSNATDLADYLVAKGIPFRDAHELTGALVLKAAAAKVALEALPLAEMQHVCPLITEDVFAALTIEAGLAKRNAYGGTSPQQVLAALKQSQLWFDSLLV
ncbi:argininosuccinate lyase [Alishewanella longhuensis]